MATQTKTVTVTGTDGNDYKVTYTATGNITVDSVEPLDEPVPVPPDPNPEPTGWPDETNTGPAAGTQFTSFSGEHYVKQDNAVVKNLKGKGVIIVQARNVTVQDCDVDASGMLYGIGTEDKDLGLKVIRCHVFCNGGPATTDAERSANRVLNCVQGASEVAFCNFHGGENFVTLGGAFDSYIHDNYLHDHANWPTLHDDHTDGIQTYDSSNTGGLRVIHNTFHARDTCGNVSPEDNRVASSAIALSENQHDMEISDNFIAGGTYSIYGPSQAGAEAVNIKVTNNHFSTMYKPKCGEYGCSSGFNKNAPGFVWTGNVIHETGAKVDPA